MAASKTPIRLYDETFTVEKQDPDDKKFDKVSRFKCVGGLDAELLLDVNIDIYPLKENDVFTLALASTLSLDGTADDGTFDQSGQPSLMDKYEYVMYGKIFRVNEDRSTTPPRLEVLASFGGLLMSLKGEADRLAPLENDKRIYLLMRLVKADRE